MKYVNFAFLILFFALFVACDDEASAPVETEPKHETEFIYTHVTDTLRDTITEIHVDTIIDERDRHNIEYDTLFIDPSCTTQEIDGVVTITCGSKEVAAIKATCDTIGFDPAKNFCFNGKITDFCDGFAYNPEKYFCYQDSLMPKYRGEIYDASKYFIVSDSLFILCKGKQYNTNVYFCQNDSLITKCGENRFDFLSEYCENNSIYDLCNGKKYNHNQFFCLQDSLVYLCDGQTYDPTQNFCYDDRVFPLCNGKEYHALDYFCYDGYLVNYCEGKEFDPSQKFCYNDSLIEQKDCPAFLKYNRGCGYFADERDKQMYKYVTIGTQTWMAQNLNYAYTQPTSTLDSSSFCYWNTIVRTQEKYYSGSITQNFDVLYNGTCPKYGRLYLWSAAMDSAAIFSNDGDGCGYGVMCDNKENIRGACPEGWHLPSTTEWNKLHQLAGFDNLQSKLYWKGEPGLDLYGFSALPAGYLHENTARDNIGIEAGFWYSSSDSRTHASYMYLFSYTFKKDIDSGKNFGRSIRCIKDND